MKIEELKALLDSAWLVLGGAAWLLWKVSRLIKRVEESPTRQEFEQLRASNAEVRKELGLDPVHHVVVVTPAPPRRRIDSEIVEDE